MKANGLTGIKSASSGEATWTEAVSSLFTSPGRFPMSMYRA